jgi:hypothetical protein
MKRKRRTMVCLAACAAVASIVWCTAPLVRSVGWAALGKNFLVVSNNGRGVVRNVRLTISAEGSTQPETIRIDQLADAGEVWFSRGPNTIVGEVCYDFEGTQHHEKIGVLFGPGEVVRLELDDSGACRADFDTQGPPVFPIFGERHSLCLGDEAPTSPSAFSNAAAAINLLCQ